MVLSHIFDIVVYNKDFDDDWFIKLTCVQE